MPRFGWSADEERDEEEVDENPLGHRPTDRSSTGSEISALGYGLIVLVVIGLAYLVVIIGRAALRELLTAT
jgi:hypothetical protein